MSARLVSRRAAPLGPRLVALPRLVLSAWLLSGGVSRAQPAAPAEPAASEPSRQVFTVETRDGAVLRVALADEVLPWRRITRAGEILDEPIPLARVDKLTLVREPASKQVAQARHMAHRLGHEDFHEREAAQQKLIEDGGPFRNLLQSVFEVETDPEIRWRLNLVLKRLPNDAPSSHASHDLLSRVGGADGDALAGDLGDWKLRCVYRGGALELGRDQLFTLRRAPPELHLSAAAIAPLAERIPHDHDRYVPKEATRLDFEQGPRGEALTPGQDLAELFVPVGVRFSTSLPDSVVSIAKYNVGGRSGGNCVANLRPLYHGVLTIRFCQPGFANQLAGVSFVGFWTAHVSAGGTRLQAFDALDRKIAEVATTRSPREFLAVKSNTPIAYARVTPNPEVDPDFAIDDLTFTPPRPLTEAGDPDYCHVLLTSGERLLGRVLETTPGEGLVLRELTCGLSELKFPTEALAAVLPRGRTDEFAAAKPFGLARLVDGSVLRVSGGAGPRAARFPDLPLPPERICALWSAKAPLSEPGADAWPTRGALLLEPGKPPRALVEWKLGALGVESPEWPEAAAHPYETTAPLWLRKPEPALPGAGLARLRSGDELVLAPGAFEWVGWIADGCRLRSGGREYDLPLGEIRSLILPRK